LTKSGKMMSVYPPIEGTPTLIQPGTDVVVTQIGYEPRIYKNISKSSVERTERLYLKHPNDIRSVGGGGSEIVTATMKYGKINSYHIYRTEDWNSG